MTRHSRLKKILGISAAVVVALVVLFFVGPRYDGGPLEPSQRPAPPVDIAQLDSWLARSEAAFPDIRPHNAKGIVWQGAAGSRTEWVVLYLHGFSASRLETAPLAETVAHALNANIFYTRLSGHGRSSEAMAQVRLQDWLADSVEALAIARQLGKKVLVISCSTGSTLATWLALQPQGRDISAHVFISPNFGPKDKRSELLTGPWGQQIAQAVTGPMYGKTSPRAEVNNAWTTRYPTAALFPMMALVTQVRQLPLEKLNTPLLMLYSQGDQTVDPQQSLQAFARIGSAHKRELAITDSQAEGQHVLAGELTDPQAVAPMAATIVRWVQGL